MATIYWGSLLHFYQPPIQIPGVLRKVIDESYRPLIDVFATHPHAKASVNINGVLTEMLYESGYTDVIDGLRELAERGQIEFVGSAKYHAILPLIPEEEQRRQIRRNHLTNRHFFGEAYQPKGFFPPEMCYDKSFLDPMADLEHEWVIMSGVACPAAWPTTEVYKTRTEDGREVGVIFRDDVLSNKISFQDMDGKAFVRHLRSSYGNSGDMYIVTAMDAETFGHHIENWDQLFLAEAYDAVAPYEAVVQPRSLAASTRTLLAMTREGTDDPVVSSTISEIIERFPQGEMVEPRPASWSTTHEDLDAGVPYPLWQAPGNYIHKLQWEHVDLMDALVHVAQDVADTATSKRHAEIARGLMDPALHSCQFWWASRRPHWDVNMIARGLDQQAGVVLNAFRAINLSSASEEVKRDAYYKVVATRDIRSKIHDQLCWD
ncbi:MAG: hypothetical protein M3P30_06220 [Chloroflexota bacterium]|nr:hypothetical protein [Chloroflexota bacterium]